MSLAIYQDKLRRLKVNIAHGRASPHKICMLLALLDLARSGGLVDNRIAFAPPLLERYHRLFAAVRTPSDHANPYFPFFHLTGSLRGNEPSFWHLRPLPGREAVLASMQTARSLADITNNVAHASLDPELFDLLQQPESLEALAETLSVHWLDRGLQDLRAVAASTRDSRLLDRRIPDFARLTSLHGQSLFLPQEVRFAPKRESLARRLEQLRKLAD